MKRFTLTLLIFMSPTLAQPAYADAFGADVVVLGKILANAISQLYQLMTIVQQGRDSLNLMRDINRGVNDSLAMMRTLDPKAAAGLYANWRTSSDALTRLQSIYGQVPRSADAGVQGDVDKGVAEAISMNNSLYDYAKQIDAIGEQIKSFSHSVSPGGAAKLSAQSMGVMVHVMDQSLRAQATGLKMQAQNLALKNKQDKDMTRHILQSSRDLSSAMRREPAEFRTPRF